MTYFTHSSACVGTIMNMMTNDVKRIEHFFAKEMHSLFTSPIQLILALYLIYEQVGLSVFAGIIFLLLTLPIQVTIVTFHIFGSTITNNNLNYQLILVCLHIYLIYIGFNG
jgi:ABC-type multidrug transport system fused ATPase/permease subunit